MHQPVDDKTKELFKKLEGKTYIEEEFSKENMKTRALTKEALDIVADYTRGEKGKVCSAVDEAKKLMDHEEQLVRDTKKQLEMSKAQKSVPKLQEPKKQDQKK